MSVGVEVLLGTETGDEETRLGAPIDLLVATFAQAVKLFSRSLRSTWEPSSINFLAMASPIPCPAPVMSATLVIC